MKNIRSDVPEHQPDGPEHDSCAIYMSARKQGQSTFGTLKRALGALVQMGHRTGFVNGEGDGAGVQTDIPRRLWSKKLSQAGLRAYLATSPGFWVGHLFIPHDLDPLELQDALSASIAERDLGLLVAQPGRVRLELLGPNARINPPHFWQIAGYSEAPDLEKRLLAVQLEIEAQFPVHFASLSSYTVIYKVRGSVESLSRYFLDLQDTSYDTALVLCHARYSTNTVSNFERAQPFAILGHNGEINTINRLRLEAEQIGATLPRDGSDSQDLDRTLQTLCVDYGLSLIEAMEMVFPPTPFELCRFSPDLEAAYSRIRQSFGPYAQGPAGIVARYGNTIVASVDALGLRPLWFVETEKEFVFSSERGAIPLEVMVGDARALAPGEKVAIIARHGENCQVMDHAQIRQQVMAETFRREAPQLASKYWTGQGREGNRSSVLSHQSIDFGTAENQSSNGRTAAVAELDLPEPAELPTALGQSNRDPDLPYAAVNTTLLAANGWLRDHLNDAYALVSADKDDLVSSLGYDGPLAPLSKVRVNLADYFKEFSGGGDQPGHRPGAGRRSLFDQLTGRGGHGNRKGARPERHPRRAENPHPARWAPRPGGRGDYPRGRRENRSDDLRRPA